MAAEAFIERVTFAGGELGRALAARSDLGKYQVALAAMENYVTMVEGGATRSPGTRFVAELKDSTHPGRLVPYRRSSTDAYLLVINVGVARFVQSEGVVLNAGVPVEAAVPWADADLNNIRAVTDGDALYACDGVRATQITRNSLTSWTATAFANQGGPVGVINVDPTVTIGVSATTGNSIALTGIGTNWQAGNVGGVWRLDESTLSLTAEWIGNETITVPATELPAATGNIGSLTNLANAFDENVATEATQSNLAANAFWYAGQTFAAGQSIVSATIQDPSKTIAAVHGAPAAWNSTAVYVAGNQATYGGSIWSALTPPFGPNQGYVPSSNPAEWTNIGIGAYACALSLYAKNGVPANATDGVLLGTGSVGTGSGYNVTIQSTDAVSTFTNIWLAGTVSGGASDIVVGEIDFLQFSAGGAPVLRRWNGKVYQAIGGGNSGANPPVHASGAVLSGTAGVTWLYRHRDRGYVQITAVASAISATANVLERVPDSVLAVPTTYFWPAAWDAIAGYPTSVAFSKDRLVFTRGPFFWGSAIGAPLDFDLTGQDDDAIAGKLKSPDGSLVDIKWALHAGLLILGATDIEWTLRGSTAFAGLTPGTMTPVPDSSDGSVAQIPASVDGGVIFVGKSGDRLHFAKFDLNDTNSQRVSSEEISVTARHIFVPGVHRIAWQRDPQRVLWMAMADGTLAALTFMPKQQIIAFHRHPRSNAFIEDIAAIPATNAQGVTFDQVYTIARRVINGATKRYVEAMRPFFAPLNPDPAAAVATGAWFLDCALRYQGAPATVIAGLDYLEGQVVGVFADAAMQARKTVTGGSITLDRAAADVLVGLPIVARLQDLPRNLNSQAGPTDGQDKTVSEGYLNVLYCGGGVLSVNDGPGESIIETGQDNYGSPPPLFTGDKRIPIEGELRPEAQMQILNDDAMPCTVLGMSPRLRVEED